MRGIYLFSILILLLCSPAVANDCPARPVTIHGESLSPLLHDGAAVMMKPVSCAGAVRRGDLVVFHTGAHDLPVIKIAKALPGDRFAVTANGTIRVNGEDTHNSTGKSYVLPPSSRAMLESYQSHYKGVLPAGTYLLLGDGANGVIDSTRIGLVHASDFMMVGTAPR